MNMNNSNVNFESPAIRALGPLFKLTQVFISDDGYSSDSPQSSSFPKHTRFKYVDDYNDENYDDYGVKIGSNASFGTTGETRQFSSLPKHIRFEYDDDDDDDDDDDIGAKISSNTIFESADVVIAMEDLGFTREMSALGLPLSFKTSKQNSSGKNKKKSKAVQSQNQRREKRSDDQELGSRKISEESLSGADSQDKRSNSSSLSLPDQNGLASSGSDISCDIVKSTNSRVTKKPLDTASEPTHGGHEEDIHDSKAGIMSSKELDDVAWGTDLQLKTKMMSIDATSDLSAARTCSRNDIFDDDLEHQEKGTNAILTEHVNVLGPKVDNSVMQEDIRSSIEQTQVGDLSNDCQNMMLEKDYDENFRSSSTSDDWSALWDSFYGRYYFYNAETQESTWIPPPGMESFIYCTSNDTNAEVPGSNGTHEPYQSEQEQMVRSELVDQDGLDGGKNTWGAGEVAAYVLLSVSGTPFENTCINDSNGSCEFVEQYQDESALSSLVVSSQQSCSSTNGRKLEDSGDVCNGHLKSENTDAIGKTFEFVDRNYDCNMTAQLLNSRRSASEVEALCIHDLSNHKHLEERGTIVNDFPMKEIVAGSEGDTIIDDLPMEDIIVVAKEKTRRKNRKKKKSFNTSEDYGSQQAEENYVDITKYWCQRYLLFSRYDEGIKMDDEGWFSVTPEAIARHQALRCGGGIVIDCFTGAGGNAIQFAKTSKHVIGIDIDPKKIDYARHNATIYGVEGVIDFMIGDALSVVSKVKADAVFLSPPWGGPDYVKVESYDLSMLQPYDGHHLFHTFKTIASMIVMFLPRNVDIVQLAELALSANPPWSLEVEENFLNGKFKAVTAYFSRTLA